MSFRLVPHSVTLNDLNCVVAPIFAFLRYFTEFGSFRGALCESEDTPTPSTAEI